MPQSLSSVLFSRSLLQSFSLSICHVRVSTRLYRLLQSAGLIVRPYFEFIFFSCWIRADYVAVGVVLPITFVLINALFCTSLVVVRLFRSRSSHHMVSFLLKPQLPLQIVSEENAARKKIISVILMQFNLGTPWVEKAQTTKSFSYSNISRCSHRMSPLGTTCLRL